MKFPGRNTAESDAFQIIFRRQRKTGVGWCCGQMCRAHRADTEAVSAADTMAAVALPRNRHADTALRTDRSARLTADALFFVDLIAGFTHRLPAEGKNLTIGRELREVKMDREPLTSQLLYSIAYPLIRRLHYDKPVALAGTPCFPNRSLQEKRSVS